MAWLDLSPNTVIDCAKRFPDIKYDIVGERFQFGGKLGSGAFGVVYLAREKNPGETEKKCNVSDDGVLAIKVLDLSRNLTINICSEINILLKLKHACTILVKEVFRDKQRYYIVSDLYRCGSFYDMVTPAQPDYPAYNTMFNSLVTCIDDLHAEGIVHRDLKPENIMMASKMGDPKIIDFGYAVDLAINPEDMCKLVGTMDYVNRYQLSACKEKDWEQCTKVYMFGDYFQLILVFYYAIVGYDSLTDAETETQLVKNIETAKYNLITHSFDDPLVIKINEVLTKMMQRDPIFNIRTLL
jgi:serine/threonine protein kinase